MVGNKLVLAVLPMLAVLLVPVVRTDASVADDPIYTGVSVIGDGQGGFPAGWLDTSDWFGNAIGRIGDINGDTITDFVVGAYRDNDAGADAGAVYVLQMTAQTTVDRAFKITEGLRGFAGNLDASDLFGYSADGVGDVDGNGVEDIAVGAHGDDDAATNAGAVYVMLMEANVQVKTTVKITTGQGDFAYTLSALDYFGTGLAGVGDIDDNGVPDIAVGAYGDDTGASGAGAVYVLRMLATGRVSSSTKIANAMGGLSSPLVGNDWFGFRVAALGDVNNDGVPDIAVGALHTSRAGQLTAGSVYILHLASSGSVIHDYEITTNTSGFDHSLVAHERFASPSRVGDVDGDGIDDLAVGAWGTNSVYVLLMDGDGLVRENNKITNIATDSFGRSVSFVERGMGVSLLVGAPSSGTGGSVYVVDLVDRSLTTPSTTSTRSPTASTTPSPSAPPSPSPSPEPPTAMDSTCHDDHESVMQLTNQLDNDHEMACADVKDFCHHRDFGAYVRARCGLTCGGCDVWGEFCGHDDTFGLTDFFAAVGIESRSDCAFLAESGYCVHEGWQSLMWHYCPCSCVEFFDDLGFSPEED